MSAALRESAESFPATHDYTQHAQEMVQLADGTIISADESVEEPLEFVLEERLEDSLVKEWAHTELGKGYEL